MNHSIISDYIGEQFDDDQQIDHQIDHQIDQQYVHPYEKLTKIDTMNTIPYNTFVKKLVYRSYDGMSLSDVKVRKIMKSDKKFIQADCCGLFFSENAFFHDKKGFSIPGMITCIHCYIALNTAYYKSDNLKSDEKILLTDYIENFTPHHDEKKCTRSTAYENCFLCDKILNVLPKSIDLPNPINENDRCSIFDKTVVKKSSARLFILSI